MCSWHDGAGDIVSLVVQVVIRKDVAQDAAFFAVHRAESRCGHSVFRLSPAVPFQVFYQFSTFFHVFPVFSEDVQEILLCGSCCSVVAAEVERRAVSDVAFCGSVSVEIDRKSDFVCRSHVLCAYAPTRISPSLLPDFSRMVGTTMPMMAKMLSAM